MAKAPRPSIADQLASIAATSPRGHVDTSPREDAKVEPRPAEKSSRDPASNRQSSPPVPSDTRDISVTVSRDHVLTRRHANEPEDGLKIRQRIEKPHVSLYAHPRVLKKLREIAVAEDCKPHDLYVQGLRLVLNSYGFYFDKLERSEE